MAENDNPQMTILPNDVVGIIQRQLAELGSYLNQPIGAIDPAVCVAYVDRMQQFAYQLRAMQQAMAKSAADGKAEPVPARKN